MLRESKRWHHKRSKAKTKKLSEGPIYWSKLAKKRSYFFTTTSGNDFLIFKNRFPDPNKIVSPDLTDLNLVQAFSHQPACYIN